MRFTLACAALLMAATRALSAQIATPSALAGARCSYASCALGLAPVLSGLDVVRGASNERVGTLNFFWPHGVHALLGVATRRPIMPTARFTRA